MRVFVAFLILFGSVSHSLGGEIANCGNDWTILGNPCHLASQYLHTPGCANTDHPFPPPSPVDVTFPAYLGPDTTQVNNCTCYYTLYNLFSACAACQQSRDDVQDDWQSLADWLTNCSSFPDTGNLTFTSVTLPVWAMQYTDVFDINAAIQDAEENGPTITTDAASSTVLATLSISDGTISASVNGNQGTQSPVSAISKKSSSVGAIAGGVVGGVVALAVIGLALAYLLIHRKRKQTAPSAAFANDDAPPPFTAGSFSQTPYEKVRPVEDDA